MGTHEMYYRVAKQAAAEIRHLPKNLGEILSKKVELLATDPTNPTLGSYALDDVKAENVYAFKLPDGHRVVYDFEPEVCIWYIGKHDIADRRYKRLTFSATKWETVGLGPEPSGSNCCPEPTKEAPNQSYPYVELTSAHLCMLGVASGLLSTVQFCPSYENLRNIPGIAEDVARRVNELALRSQAESQTDEETLFKRDDLVYRANISQLQNYCCGNVKQLLVNLNPEQEELATRGLTSSILVRGCAGSGKTSVALQRAANLFLRNKKVLYVTYTNILEDYAKSLLLEIAGSPLPDKIEIWRMRQLGLGILRERGCWGGGSEPRIQESSGRLEDYMSWACERAAPDDTSSVLKKPAFVLDEVHGVIKYNALSSEDEYLGVQRFGRGTALGPDARHAVWHAYTQYQAILKSRKEIEWADIPVLVLQELQVRPFDHYRYDEVIVDEAQDLSAADIRLCALLAPVAFIVGDVAQSIYSRGYSWRAVGLDVRGHSYFLKHNYRNTKEIAEAGQSLVESRTDESESDELALPEYAKRHGPWPVVLQAGTIAGEVDAIRAKILGLTEGDEFHCGDFAILCRTNDDCKLVCNHLNESGIPTWRRPYANERYARQFSQSWPDFDPFEDSVKVLTYYSAKGLEFPVVLVYRCNEGDLPFLLHPDDPDLNAIVRLQCRILYVAMTRAIEAVYLVTSPYLPSRFLSELPREKITLEQYGS